MYIHKKELLHPVVVTEPSPQFAQFLLEQFGGATGELSAGLQYFVQAQHTDDPNLRDMLLDISTEEFGHLEIVAHLIEAHTKGSQQAQAYQSTLFSVRGKGAHFLDSQGVEWSAKYINEGANPVRDLRADIAAEGGGACDLRGIDPKSARRRHPPSIGTSRDARSRAHQNVHDRPAIDEQISRPAVRQFQARQHRRPLFQFVVGRHCQRARAMERGTQFPLRRRSAGRNRATQ